MPEGISCGEQDLLRWDSQYNQIEKQANEFAATLLMPLDDFRIQLGDRDKPTFERLSFCAERYGVSLTAVILRWLEYTSRRACLVISREGVCLVGTIQSTCLEEWFLHQDNQPTSSCFTPYVTGSRCGD